MDRVINSKIDKQSIYEIYRACRLCGAGAGYKMPIIQNVLDLEGDEVELKKKIRECVHIEVHQDDKMPPLICELCVDKVNDFYEFLDMCRKTNKRTRQRLGLPSQRSKDASDAGDCILGVTEPVYINDDEDDEPLSRGPNRNSKYKNVKSKKPEIKIKLGSRPARSPPPLRKRTRSRSPSPEPRATRNSRAPPAPPTTPPPPANNRIQTKKLSKVLPPPPKSILKKEYKEDNSVASLRSKRSREPPKPEVHQKKVKLSLKLSLPKPAPKSRTSRPAPPVYTCVVCQYHTKTSQGLTNHLRTHTVSYTSSRLACNACCEWFPSAEAAAAHHRRHRARALPYVCRACLAPHAAYAAYEEHVEVSGCVPWTEVADVKCDTCWRLYPTFALRDLHKCAGEDGRPGGKCSKCKRNYALLKNLKKHEKACTSKRRGTPVDPRVRLMRVRVARCDPLLRRRTGQQYDVAGVAQEFGLDPNCVYPYLKSLKLDHMVNIKSEIDDFYCEEDYVHWDSDVSSDDDVSGDGRQVSSLSTLALKVIYSDKMLGKVPKKRRKLKTEKGVFDSLLNDFGDDISSNIDNLIGKLGDDDNDQAVNNIQEDSGDIKCSISKTSEGTSNDVSGVNKCSDRGETKCPDVTQADQDPEMAKDVKTENNDIDETRRDEIDISKERLSEECKEDININDNRDVAELPSDSIDAKLKTQKNDSLENNIRNAVLEVRSNKDRSSFSIEQSDIQNNSRIRDDISNDSIFNDNSNTDGEVGRDLQENVNKSEIVIKSVDNEIRVSDKNINVDKAESRNALDEERDISQLGVAREDAPGNKEVDNNYENEINDKLNGEANDGSDTEIDDKKLMDALNEHIGESNDKPEVSDATIKRNEVKNRNASDDGTKGKITLDDLLPKEDASMQLMQKIHHDLDSISEEDFHFNS